MLSSSGTRGRTSVGCLEPRNFRHLGGKTAHPVRKTDVGQERNCCLGQGEFVLPDRVAVGGVLVEVLQELQQSQLDTLFIRHVGVADQLMERLSDVPGFVLHKHTPL